MKIEIKKGRITGLLIVTILYCVIQLGMNHCGNGQVQALLQKEKLLLELLDGSVPEINDILDGFSISEPFPDSNGIFLRANSSNIFNTWGYFVSKAPFVQVGKGDNIETEQVAKGEKLYVHRVRWFWD